MDDFLESGNQHFLHKGLDNKHQDRVCLRRSYQMDIHQKFHILQGGDQVWVVEVAESLEAMLVLV